MRTAGTLLLVLVIPLLGCSGYRSYREAQIAERHGDWDKAVLHYLELVDQYPSNISYKAGLLRSKIKASQDHFDRAKKLHQAGALEQARRPQHEEHVHLDTAQHGEDPLSPDAVDDPRTKNVRIMVFDPTGNINQ